MRCGVASLGPEPGLTSARVGQAIDEWMAWPLRVRGCAACSRMLRLRANVTLADALYVALAEHLGADLLSDDVRLANTPRLPVRVLRLA